MNNIRFIQKRWPWLMAINLKLLLTIGYYYRSDTVFLLLARHHCPSCEFEIIFSLSCPQWLRVPFVLAKCAACFRRTGYFTTTITYMFAITFVISIYVKCANNSVFDTSSKRKRFRRTYRPKSQWRTLWQRSPTISWDRWDDRSTIDFAFFVGMKR